MWKRQRIRHRQPRHCWWTRTFFLGFSCAQTVRLLSTVGVGFVRAQQSDPMTMNGGSVLAMAGRECVALAVDKRFGRDLSLIAVRPRQVLFPTPRLLVAFTGLEGDVQSLREELSAQIAFRYARGSGFGPIAAAVKAGTSSSDDENGSNKISPRAMSSLTSHVLYHQKGNYFVEPIVAGLEPDDDGTDGSWDEKEVPSDNDSAARRRRTRYRPFLCSMDMIGAQSVSSAFVCGGAASDSLYGTAEALWEPDLKPQDLVRVCGRAFLSALERNCLSGYGAVIYLVTPEGVTEYDLVTRND